jgi:putative ABC transport system substrate-binding protein
MKMLKLAWSCALLAISAAAQAQPVNLKRIGVIHAGGPYEAVLEGMRAGLKHGGLAEGKHFVLHIRNTKGDLRGVGDAARQLASERVDLLFTITTSVSAAAKKATTDIPIVFYAGNDPVRAELVDSLAKPGGRVTGVQHRSTEVAPKRLELLRQVLPKARRVVMFYLADNRSAQNTIALSRGVAAKLGLELIERPVGSTDELVAAVQALRPGEVDAYISSGDAMQTSAAPLILPLARARKLPVIVQDLNMVEAGALMAYGGNYFDVGVRSANHVQRILAGARPQDIPVEIYDKVQLGLNLRVAKELGITIPQPVILRADQVVR